MIAVWLYKTDANATSPDAMRAAVKLSGALITAMRMPVAPNFIIPRGQAELRQSLVKETLQRQACAVGKHGNLRDERLISRVFVRFVDNACERTRPMAGAQP